MTFKKKLERLFAAVILFALLFLAKNIYEQQQFRHQGLSSEEKEMIALKEQELLDKMQQNLGYRHKFKLVVTDRFKGNLYGLTSYQDGQIVIYLNKKVMFESMDYILESVIAHEYAHALMFEQGHFKDRKGGHTEQWQLLCRKLGGKECGAYVNQQEVIMAKMPFH